MTDCILCFANTIITQFGLSDFNIQSSVSIVREIHVKSSQVHNNNRKL